MLQKKATNTNIILNTDAVLMLMRKHGCLKYSQKILVRKA
ncbi:MAG: hypothetical protein ACFWT3_00505 [Pseudomonas lundensis]